MFDCWWRWWSIPPRSRTFLHHCRSSIWNGCHDRPSEKSKFLLAIAKAMRITNQIITKSIFCYIPELLWRKSMLQCIISVAAPTHWRKKESPWFARSATRRRTSPSRCVPASNARTLGRRKKKPGLQGEILLRNPGFSYVCLILLPIGSVQFLLRRDGRLAISKSPYQAAALRFCCSECQEMWHLA